MGCSIEEAKQINLIRDLATFNITGIATTSFTMTESSTEVSEATTSGENINTTEDNRGVDG